jgi:hypothetical protein
MAAPDVSYELLKNSRNELLDFLFLGSTISNFWAHKIIIFFKFKKLHFAILWAAAPLAPSPLRPLAPRHLHHIASVITITEFCSNAFHSFPLNEIRTNAVTLTLLKWRIGWAPNNASRWQMGFNLPFKGLKVKGLGVQFWFSCCINKSLLKFIVCGRRLSKRHAIQGRVAIGRRKNRCWY